MFYYPLSWQGAYLSIFYVNFHSKTINQYLRVHWQKIAQQASDMEFVKNFTLPDFQAKSFTPQKCVICDSFFAN